jgi:hypothetical protein
LCGVPKEQLELQPLPSCCHPLDLSNQEQPDESTKEKKELIWGYGTGVAAATTPNYGDVVLAEYT